MSGASIAPRARLLPGLLHSGPARRPRPEGQAEGHPEGDRGPGALHGVRVLHRHLPVRLHPPGGRPARPEPPLQGGRGGCGAVRVLPALRNRVRQGRHLRPEPGHAGQAVPAGHLMAEPGPPELPVEDAVSSPTPAGRLLVQFFVIPLFVVGVAVFVFWLFGAIAVDRKNAAELLNDVRTGSRNQRWQSAFELTKKLPALTDPKERAAFSAAALRAFEGAENDDPRVKRYLTLVLGRLGDPSAVTLLEKTLDDKDHVHERRLHQ